MVQASGWPGYRPGHRQLPAAGRRLVVEQPGEGLGDRDGRVAEPQANLAVLAAMTSPSVSRRTRDSGRPCSSIKLAATPVLKLRSFAGGEAAEQGGLGASGAAVPPLRPSRALRSGRAAAPAGPPGRSLRLRCNPRSRRGICLPGPPKTPATGIPASNAARIKLVRVRPAARRPAKPKAVARRKVSASPIDPVPDFLPVAGGAIIVALMLRPAARRAHRATERHRPATGDGSLPELHHRARPAPRIPPSRPAGPTSSIHDQLTGNRLVSGRAAVSPAPAGYQVNSISSSVASSPISNSTFRLT